MLKIWGGIVHIVILVHRVIILRLRSFSYNFGTIIVSDVNNNAPGTVLPSQNWKIGPYKAYCNSLDDYEVYFSGVSGIDPSGASLVIIRGVIYLFQ